jgi:hypothetical protein
MIVGWVSEIPRRLQELHIITAGLDGEFGWWDGKTWLYSKDPSQVWRLQKNVGFSERHSWTIDMVCFHGTCLLRISGSWTTNELNYVKQPSWLMLKWPHANWFSGLLYNLRISMGYNLIDMYITRQTVHNVHTSSYIYLYLHVFNTCMYNIYMHMYLHR